MKPVSRLCFCLLAIISIAANATQRTIEFTQSGMNITAKLRALLSPLHRGDTVSIFFGEGSFIIDGSIDIQPHATIKGAGTDKTQILLTNTGTFKGDYYLCFNGKKGHEVSVQISDLSLDMMPHDSIWWDLPSSKYVLKFVSVNGVNIHNFASNLFNAYATTMDFRVCSNVDIHDCVLVNNNNCNAGGIIWMRRNNRNISITDNKFVKYGDDEIFAFWDGGDDEREKFPPLGTKDNIIIADNDIYYTPCDNANEIILDVLFAIYNVAQIDRNTAIHFSNIAVERNNFYLNAPVWRLFTLIFKEGDTYDNIRFADNQIRYSKDCGYQGHAHCDFQISDPTSNPSVITISGNEVTNESKIFDKNGNSGNYFISMDGGIVDMADNRIESASGNRDGKKYGATMLWTQSRGGRLTMRNNDIAGLLKLASISGGKSVENVEISATGNTFTGDTRIYCRNVQRADLNFTGNTFNNTSFEMFLQEYPATGSVTFKNNTVNASRDCRLFSRYDKTNSFNFESIDVSGNRLRGVAEQTWLRDAPQAPRRTIRNNR